MKLMGAWIGRSAGCVLVALVCPLASGQQGPITLTEIDRQIGGLQVRGWVAQVDLSNDRVDVVVTAPAPAGTGAEAVLTRTDAWAESNDLDLAINANFFGSLGGGLADIVGLSISDAAFVSGVRSFGGDPDPSALFMPDGTLRIGRFSANDVAAFNPRDAVAGVGGSSTDNDPGTLLVDDGVNIGATARVQPGVRNPRTAIGVSQDGETLVLMVIDGRQNNWSRGVTLPQLADLMIEFGAYDALNLDGGGSSSFIYDDGTREEENRPSDGAHRAVANHLGIRVLPPVTDAEQSRTRGAWLRPPASLASFENTCIALASAGIRDVYLETFYWGLATHDSDVFNDRFTFDYLQEAIRIGASRGVRVHAWLEAGYWSFNGSGDYILDQNPEWKVVDVYGNTDIGDIPGQVFVNLGHPGVQQKLADLCAELAEYDGLFGIQTDYHRYPLDNNTGDNRPAPYSYDTYNRSLFQSIYFVDPIFGADVPSDVLYDEWIDLQELGIAEAAREMRDAMHAVEPSLDFSGAIFSGPEPAKMQDWRTMGEMGWLDTLVPMAYNTSTSGIANSIATVVADKGQARVVAGLANLKNIPRPSVSAQLGAVYAQGVTDFIWFDAPTLVGDQAMRDELRNFLLANGPIQSADIDEDLDVDGHDWTLFELFFPAEPTPVNPLNESLDVDGSGIVDVGDRAAFRQQFILFRFGRDGVVNERDMNALLATWTGPGPGTQVPEVTPLYDLDGDNDVDQDDLNRLYLLATEPLPLDLDVNRDGRISVDDLYEQNQNPIDVNRDAQIDASDQGDLEAHLRANEIQDMLEAGPDS